MPQVNSSERPAVPERILNKSVTVSLVIPCYNEQEVLPLLYERITAAARDWPVNYEIVLVDDGSSDDTWDQLVSLRERDSRCQIVRLARNFGHQIALWTGFQHARGQVIAVLDADLQDPPEVLPRFFDQWQQGYDVVYAVRRKRKESIWKRFAYTGFYRLLQSLSEIAIPLDSGDFCVMDRCVLDTMLECEEQEPFIRGLRSWVGFKQTGLEYERSARAAGEVKYTLRKLLGLAANGIFSFSNRPLRLASYLGLAVSACSFAGAALTFLQRVFHEQFAAIGFAPVPGFATIVIAVLFMGGVQLICLGILGEYIGRIYANSKRRPRTVVAETHGFEGSSSEQHWQRAA